MVRNSMRVVAKLHFESKIVILRYTKYKQIIQI